MTTIADRLRDAIDKWGSINSFAKEMGKRGAQGASKQMIHRYLSPTKPVAPPVNFLEVAADVLGVRVAWLAFEEKPRTQAWADAAQQTEDAAERIADLFQERINRDEWPNFTLSVEARAMFSGLVRRALVTENKRRAAWGEEASSVEAVAGRVAVLALGPLEPHWRDSWMDWEFNRYLVAILHAIGLVLPDEERFEFGLEVSVADKQE